MIIRKENMNDTNKIGVYLITNLVNSKRYVGKCSVFKGKGIKRGFLKRWKEHIWGLKRNKHRNKYLQRAFNKYGIDNFEFSILEIVDTIDDVTKLNNILNFWEMYWIAYYNTNNFNNGYNMTIGGEGGLCRIVTDKQKEKQSKIMKDKYAKGEIKSWNKGLTKETDERLKFIGEKGSTTLKLRYMLGEIKPANKGLTKEKCDYLMKVSKSVSKTLKEKYALGEIQNWNKGKFGEDSNHVGYHVGTNIKTGERIVLCGSHDITDNGFTTSGVAYCESGEYKQHKGFKFKKVFTKEELNSMGLDYPLKREG